MYAIDPDILRRLKKDLYTRGLIIEHFGCHKETVRLWVNNNNPALTTYGVLEILSEGYGLSFEELIVEF